MNNQLTSQAFHSIKTLVSLLIIYIKRYQKMIRLFTLLLGITYICVFHSFAAGQQGNLNVTGILLDESSKTPLDNLPVVLHNITQSRYDTIYTTNGGNFAFRLADGNSYKIYATDGKLSSDEKLFDTAINSSPYVFHFLLTLGEVRVNKTTKIKDAIGINDLSIHEKPLSAPSSIDRGKAQVITPPTVEKPIQTIKTLSNTRKDPSSSPQTYKHRKNEFVDSFSQHLSQAKEQKTELLTEEEQPLTPIQKTTVKKEVPPKQKPSIKNNAPIPTAKTTIIDQKENKKQQEPKSKKIEEPKKKELVLKPVPLNSKKATTSNSTTAKKPKKAATKKKTDPYTNKIVFRITIGEFSEPLPENSAYLKQVLEYLSVEKTPFGTFRYFVGEPFIDYQYAQSYQSKISKKGYQQVLILAYKDRRLIDLPIDQILKIKAKQEKPVKILKPQ